MNAGSLILYLTKQKAKKKFDFNYLKRILNQKVLSFGLPLLFSRKLLGFPPDTRTFRNQGTKQQQPHPVHTVYFSKILI